MKVILFLLAAVGLGSGGRILEVPVKRQETKSNDEQKEGDIALNLR